jgi:uncharacterized membrane protein
MWTDRHAVLAAAVLAAGVLAASTRAGAAAFTPGDHGFLDSGGAFTQIDVPGASYTYASGINNAGQIVGNSSFGAFLDTGGSFTQINVPGATSTEALGINGAGQIVGDFIDSKGQHGFLDSGGTFTQIDVPGATSTVAKGINNAGQIVGGFYNGVTGSHGFLDTGGTFTQIDVVPAVPGTIGTSAEGINNAGQIVGQYTDSLVSRHGFLDTGGSFTQIDAPGATTGDFLNGTVASGINNAGQIVASTYNPTHGFLDSGGAFTQIDVPGATDTFALGINEKGQIVGGTLVIGGTGDPHFTTYSGVNYDFQGLGDFLLVRSNVAGDQFDVQIRTGAWSNGTSIIDGAAATLCSHVVTFDVDRATAGLGFVWLDGSPISLSVGGTALALSACNISEPSSMQYQVVWDTGETLDVTDYGTWLAVSSQLSSIDGLGSIEGLLSSEIDPDRWRVAGTASLFDPVPEPSSLTLLIVGIGLAGLAIGRGRKVSTKCSPRV